MTRLREVCLGELDATPALTERFAFLNSPNLVTQLKCNFERDGSIRACPRLRASQVQAPTTNRIFPVLDDLPSAIADRHQCKAKR